MKIPTLTLVALLGSTLAPAAAFAADSVKPDLVQRPLLEERQAHVAQLRHTRAQLAEELGTGKDRAYYRQTLENLGYHITSVNRDDPDYLEYEIIKAGDSYEVQVDFKNSVSTFINVAPNLWKARATREALKDENYRYTYPTSVTANAHEVSDRVRSKAWAEEKPVVERELGVGHDRSYYPAVLHKMGYTVTAVNDVAADTLEMEVVKGDTSYDIKVEFDAKTLKSTAIDVSPNSRESEAIERAKSRK